MTDLLGVRDGVMRPLTVDAFERWLRSDDVERDGEMSAQQWAQLWFVMETIALWPEPSSDDEGTAVDAPVEAGDDATTNTAAKLADRGAADDDDAEGTAVRPSPAEARMADEIRQILRNNDDDTGVPSPGVMTHPDDLAAPLVRFALARGAAGVISGAHVGATGTNAIDALEWIRREKAQSVESLCGEHHADFTRAMRELDGVRDGMRRLGDATKAQNAEVQRAGGGLLESMDRFGSVANEEASIDEAVTKTRLCADALRCAARCDEALSRGDLLRAVRRCDEIEKVHVPGLPKGASALGEYLRDGVRKARARAERHANRSARDWLVAARDVGRVFGAAAIARETGRGVMSGGIGSGVGVGVGRRRRFIFREAREGSGGGGGGGGEAARPGGGARRDCTIDRRRQGSSGGGGARGRRGRDARGRDKRVHRPKTARTTRHSNEVFLPVRRPTGTPNAPPRDASTSHRRSCPWTRDRSSNGRTGWIRFVIRERETFLETPGTFRTSRRTSTKTLRARCSV